MNTVYDLTYRPSIIKINSTTIITYLIITDPCITDSRFTSLQKITLDGDTSRNTFSFFIHSFLYDLIIQRDVNRLNLKTVRSKLVFVVRITIIKRNVASQRRYSN